MSAQPFLFFSLLADRKFNPGAVEFILGEGDMNALLPLIADDRFSSFSASFPCFIDNDHGKRLPPELLESLVDSGCQILENGYSFHSDEQTKPELPSSAHWLSGNWYYSQPAKLSINQATSRTLSLRLLQLVATDADTFEIEAIFRQNPVLAYHLIRLVNSIGIGVGRHISSFSQAILILGRQQLKRWLNLMLFAASRDDYRSAMLLARVAIRSRSMELLAKAGGHDRTAQENAFMTGMFSLLGVLFGMPLAEVLNPLKLNDSVAAAALKHEGVLGRMLQAVEYAECAEQSGLTDLLGQLSLSTNDFNLLSLEAHHWMLGVIHDNQDVVGV